MGGGLLTCVCMTSLCTEHERGLIIVGGGGGREGWVVVIVRWLLLYLTCVCVPSLCTEHERGFVVPRASVYGHS